MDGKHLGISPIIMRASLSNKKFSIPEHSGLMQNLPKTLLAENEKIRNSNIPLMLAIPAIFDYISLSWPTWRKRSAGDFIIVLLTCPVGDSPNKTISLHGF